MNRHNRRIAVIGSAHPHVLQIASTAKEAGFEIAGVFDEDALRREASAKELGARSFAELDAILQIRPSLALVGAVPSKRAPIAVRCARAGIDVLVDKPLALNEKELQALKSAVAETGRKILVYYPYRGHPYLRAVHAEIISGRVGKLVSVETTGPHCLGVQPRPEWHWKRSTNGDIFIDIGAHGIDICHWFASAEADDVHARMGNFNAPAHPEFRDFGTSTLRFTNGVIGKVEVDWLVPPEAGGFVGTRFSFQATKGRIDVRLGRDCSGSIFDVSGVHPLVPESGSIEAWTVDLLDRMCSGEPTDISQASVWQTSETSLRVSAAAWTEERMLASEVGRRTS